jgi:hypothetical protein
MYIPSTDRRFYLPGKRIPTLMRAASSDNTEIRMEQMETLDEIV